MGHMGDQVASGNLPTGPSPAPNAQRESATETGVSSSAMNHAPARANSQSLAPAPAQPSTREEDQDQEGRGEPLMVLQFGNSIMFGPLGDGPPPLQQLTGGGRRGPPADFIRIRQLMERRPRSGPRGPPEPVEPKSCMVC